MGPCGLWQKGEVTPSPHWCISHLYLGQHSALPPLGHLVSWHQHLRDGDSAKKLKKHCPGVACIILAQECCRRESRSSVVAVVQM